MPDIPRRSRPGRDFGDFGHFGDRDEDHAVAIANDTVYGLAGYVSSGDIGRARRVACRLRAGQVAVNHVGGNSDTPFGGYKQSGNGREKGRFGLAEYLELKAITGALADRAGGAPGTEPGLTRNRTCRTPGPAPGPWR